MKINIGQFQLSLVLFIFLSIANIFSQEDVQIGSMKYQPRQQTGFFDYSDPSGINIKVQIWGYVQYPGYYIISSNSSINDLLSLAGGPEEEALLEDIRILRTNLDSSTTLYKYDYNDLLWGEKLQETISFPKLFAGDMVIVPGEPRYFLRQDISFYLSISTALTSIAVLLISIIN
jgi:hypothetical protein